MPAFTHLKTYYQNLGFIRRSLFPSTLADELMRPEPSISKLFELANTYRFRAFAATDANLHFFDFPIIQLLQSIQEKGYLKAPHIKTQFDAYLSAKTRYAFFRTLGFMQKHTLLFGNKGKDNFHTFVQNAALLTDERVRDHLNKVLPKLTQEAWEEMCAICEAYSDFFIEGRDALVEYIEITLMPSGIIYNPDQNASNYTIGASFNNTSFAGASAATPRSLRLFREAQVIPMTGPEEDLSIHAETGNTSPTA